jgi:DNA ligase (NAD+)
MIAYKFSDTAIETKVIGLSVQVGRTGLITPVLLLERVRINRNTIGRVALSDMGDLEKFGFGKGSRVVVEQVGSAIPKISSVTARVPSGSSWGFVQSAACPVCFKQVQKESEGKRWRCMNRNCPGRLKAMLIYFLGSSGMAVKGFGPGLIGELVDAKELTSLSDAYELNAQKICAVSGMSCERAKRLIDALHKSRLQPFERFLTGLGIPRVGRWRALELARYFEDLETLGSATEAELAHLSRIGAECAREVIRFFSEDSNQTMLRKFADAGLRY